MKGACVLEFASVDLCTEIILEFSDEFFDASKLFHEHLKLRVLLDFKKTVGGVLHFFFQRGEHENLFVFVENSIVVGIENGQEFQRRIDLKLLENVFLVAFIDLLDDLYS